MTRNFDDPVYKRARQQVLKRDDYTCQMPKCGKKKRLQVHHIQPWSKAAMMRFEPYNLITLCRGCHESIKGREHHYTSMFMRIVQENEDLNR